MDVRGAASGAWDLVKLVALGFILVALLILGARLLLSSFGEEQPTEVAAEARVEQSLFPMGTRCFGEYLDGTGPPCATPQFTLAYRKDQTGPEWCVSIVYLHQKQSDVDAHLASDPVFPEDEALDLPYYRARVDGYCGLFDTSSFNGRNNPDDVNGWLWTGPVNDMLDAIRATVTGS